MVQLTLITVGEITQRHKYRWHVTTAYVVNVIMSHIWNA